MPAAVADPKRTLDSEQISPATIAHHTVYEKAPNLHQSHICQWGAQPYLMDPLSRLVGKPPLSPWLSKNVLPLTKAGNGPNSAISLTAIFDRILLYVCNSLCFGEQKAKNRDRGTIVFTATLRMMDGLGGLMMTRRRSSGCGACIPELTTRRHRGRLLCLGSRAKASTLRGRHRRFTCGSAFHMYFRGLLSLLATQQKWYHHLQQVVQSLIPHNYRQYWCT